MPPSQAQESLDAEVAVLWQRLLTDRRLRKIVQAALPAKLHAAWWSNFCGMLASFPLYHPYAKLMRGARERNKKFLRAIDAFMKAAETFEREARVSLLTLNEALTPPDAGREWDANRSYNPYDVRYAPKQRMFKYLEVLRQKVQNGEYGAETFAHWLINTPTGQIPRAKPARAAWLAIAVLEIFDAAQCQRFHEAAAACATAILGSDIDVSPKTIQVMLRDREKARSE